MWPADYQPWLVQSGTAALALALMLLKQQQRDRDRCRVLLPAYGCPDLVSAVVFAGLVPELVDTAPDLPFMDMECLDQQLDDDVLAVIGVHFLGVAERIDKLVALAAKHGTVAIEDSAQRLPGNGEWDPLASLVVLSFGRGKPAGALGGGVLLVRRGAFSNVDPRTYIQPSRPRPVETRLRRWAYNMAIHPSVYGMATRLPGLGVGITRYRPLDEIRCLDQHRATYALAQLGEVRSRQQNTVTELLGALLARQGGVVDLALCRGETNRATMPRYPVLCPSGEVRDTLHRSLTRRGLGSSVMYGKALPDLPSVPACRWSSVSHAREFAGRLLTLPVHSDVREGDVLEIGRVLAEVFREEKHGSLSAVE
ncbi:hypothetical protein G6032_10940 [Wenzhouxiangella sp. XN24]|nr:hypothetical protein [Wenzhouxiangella sp. XN24]